MAKSNITSNELVLLEARLAEHKAKTNPTASPDEFFLTSSIDTILRSRRLSYQQLEEGIVEGSDDGGIDAVYTFLNGVLVEDLTSASATESPRIELEIIQVKNERGHAEDALQKLIDHLPLLLQLESPAGLTTEFNPQVLDRFHVFRKVFLRFASKLPELSINVYYVTKADGEPHAKVQAKATRLREKLAQSFSAATNSVYLLGSANLNNMARQRDSLTQHLKVAEGPMSAEKGGWICLVRLSDYYDFIRTPDRRLREEMFEENVRGYVGETAINRGILASLQDGDDSLTDFWWLNNGITILGKRVRPAPKRLDIEDPQIVNGLQSSRCIFQYFHELTTADSVIKPTSRLLLVRVIESLDESLSTAIIKATNNQNRVTDASLKAVEPFQRNIEEFLASHGLSYERRKNYYKDLGKPKEQTVELTAMAQAVAAVVLAMPGTARARPADLLRGADYGSVFDPNRPLAAYLKSILVVRRIDEYLASVNPPLPRQSKSNIRYHLARATVAIHFQSPKPSAKVIAELDVGKVSFELIAKVHVWIDRLSDQVAKKFGIKDQSVIAKGTEWPDLITEELVEMKKTNKWLA